MANLQNTRELKQRTFLHDGGLHSVRGMDREQRLWGENFYVKRVFFFTTEAHSVELLSALKRKTGKAVGNVFF